MWNPLLVCVMNRLGNRLEPSGRPPETRALKPRIGDHLRQALACQLVHYQVLLPLAGLHLVDSYNGRMLQTGGGRSFRPEALGVLRAR